MGLNDVRERHGTEVGLSQFEHPGPHVEARPLDAHVAELDQGAQEPASDGPIDSDLARDVGDGEPDAVLSEAAQDGQSPLEGLNERPLPSARHAAPLLPGRLLRPLCHHPLSIDGQALVSRWR
ncbi:hypothetical protein BJF78_36350 [Pseudonocardia sp. CNS-139]|nr:hypothetical protein BJF78_36350 [Pseudonocardia sp. CNS-139]